jgi:hypothetical protein
MMLPYLFVILAIAIRFMPHPWHFTPLAASLLFFGARGSRRQMWIPVVLLAATDVVLTKYFYAYHFTWDQLIIWAWYAAILWLGTNLRGKAGFWRVVGAAVTSSVSFFVVSNFAAWVAMPGLYPRSLTGLMASYVAGIPFFRGTAESDLFCSLAMFATPAFLHLLTGWVSKSGDHTAAA